ncbi:MAG: hypothetical protein Q7O66_00815 [Dehalococcoidia bacterium]|nr:hypothetical protein [Dehalococcoidia bacterium]
MAKHIRIILLRGGVLVDYDDVTPDVCIHLAGIPVAWTSMANYGLRQTLTISLETAPWAIIKSPDGCIWVYAGRRPLQPNETVLWHRADAVELDVIEEAING